VGSVPTRPALLLYRCLRPFSTTAQQQSASINSHGCPRTRLPGVGEGEAAHNSVHCRKKLLLGRLMQSWYSVQSSIRVPLTRMRVSESSRITNTKLTMNSMLTRGCAPHHPRRPQRPHQSNARDHRVEVGVRDDH
jgi:hypothetical protein